MGADNNSLLAGVADTHVAIWALAWEIVKQYMIYSTDFSDQTSDQCIAKVTNKLIEVERALRNRESLEDN